MVSSGFTRFLINRIFQSIIVVWGIVTVVFLFRFISPGSPVDFIVPRDASEEVRQQIANDLGLTDPIYIQYFDYLSGLVQGEMGYSYISGTEASVRIFARLVPTIELAVVALLFALLLAVPFGVISARYRNQLPDYIATLFSLVGISTPNFWLGIMLVLILSVQFGLFPTSRRGIGFLMAFEMLISQFNPQGLLEWFRYITLPAVALGTYIMALFTRLTRSGMLEELGKPYIRAGRAKGIPETLVVYKHALRNTLIPIITVLGLQLGTLIGGAVVIEAVFNWPGLGTLLINAVNSRDWPLIQGALIVVGIGFVVINIIVDAIYGYLDPRVSYE